MLSLSYFVFFHLSPFLIVFVLAIKGNFVNQPMMVRFCLFWCKTRKFKTDAQCNHVLWTFWVMMTISGHIDISVSLTTQSHLRKKNSLQLEQKTAWVSAWWRAKNHQKQRKQATTQFGNSVQPGKKKHFEPRFVFGPSFLPFPAH